MWSYGLLNQNDMTDIASQKGKLHILVVRTWGQAANVVNKTLLFRGLNGITTHNKSGSFMFCACDVVQRLFYWKHSLEWHA